MDGGVDGQISRWIGRWQTDGWIDEKLDGWTDRWIDGWVYLLING